ncbi:MAG: hypothetical protein ACJAUP_002505, partial [Cellvibrionaceae bacterium]
PSNLNRQGTGRQSSNKAGNQGVQPTQLSISASQATIDNPEFIANQLNVLSSNVINYIRDHVSNIADLHSPATKININMHVNYALKSNVNDNVSLEVGLNTIYKLIDNLPDFQPDVTELFYALHIIFPENNSASPQSDKKLEIARSILSSYTAEWVEANKSLMEMPEELIKKHHTLQKRNNEANYEIANYSRGASSFELEEMASHPIFDDIKKSVDLIGSNSFNLNKFFIKKVVGSVNEWRDGRTSLEKVVNDQHYQNFREAFVEKYNNKKNRFQETINTTTTEIIDIRNKLGLEPSENLNRLGSERLANLKNEKLKPFCDETKKHLFEHGFKSFYARHWLGEPSEGEVANSSNSHYQSILMEHDKDKGYRVMIFDSLGAGKKIISPYISDQHDVDAIINNIGSLCYTSNTNDRIVANGQLTKHIFPENIRDSITKETDTDYKQTGTKCGIQCVKNIITATSETEDKSTAMEIDAPEEATVTRKVAGEAVSMNIEPFPLDSLSMGFDAGPIKRKFGEISSSSLPDFNIEKYSELEEWASTPDSGRELNEKLLLHFFSNFSKLLKTQEESKKSIGGMQLSPLFQKVKGSKEFSIKDYDISCKPITSATSTGELEQCEHETFFFDDKARKKDLVIHLPTRGQKPDVAINTFLESLSQSIDDLPEEQKPKHIHLSIGINGNDENITESNFQKAVGLLKVFKKNNGELPLSVKISGFQWSVSGPAGAKEFVPFGSIRNHLFDETFLERNDDSLGKGCRYIQMDGDITFNSHALKESIELKDGDYTTMPSQAASSLPEYQTTKEAFNLHWKIQKAVGEDAYFSEKMQLLSPKALRELIVLRRQGTEINGRSDCEGFYIDVNLKNSDCRFKQIPANEESVALHNYNKKYFVNNKAIESRNQFIDWLSSLSGQRENMSGSDFFAKQIARKYVANDIPIIKAIKNLYLPTLMRNGHSLNNIEKLLSALENNETDNSNEKHKVIGDQFLSDIENIPHPQRAVIKHRILSQVREILNFTKEKANTIPDKTVKFHIKSVSTVASIKMADENNDEGISGDKDIQNRKDKDESGNYQRVNVMPRMRYPKNKKQEEIKNNFIAVPSLQASENFSTMYMFGQLYSKATKKIQSDQELIKKYPNCTQDMMPKQVTAKIPRKKPKVEQIEQATKKPVSSSVLPEKWQQPPMGFNKMSADQQRMIRYEIRKEIRQYSEALEQKGLPRAVIPKWCQKNQDPLQDPIERWSRPPEGFDKMSVKKKNSARLAARNGIDRINHKHPEQDPTSHPSWCKAVRKFSKPRVLKRSPIERWLTPPEDFDKLSGPKKNAARLMARNAIDSFNRMLQEPIDHPPWCKAVRKRPTLRSVKELTQPPEDYQKLSADQRIQRARKARNSIDNHNQKLPQGHAKVDYPEWTIARTKVERHLTPLEQLQNPPPGFGTMTNKQQSTAKSTARASIDKRNKLHEQQGKPPIGYPEWTAPNRLAKPLTALDTPPEGYADMDSNGQSNARKAARARINRHNKRLGTDEKPMTPLEWCQKRK